MSKAELESKHLADLHEMAAESGIEKFRMLDREVLIAKLLDKSSGDSAASGGPASGDDDQEEGAARRPRRRRRRRRSESDDFEESGSDQNIGEEHVDDLEDSGLGDQPTSDAGVSEDEPDSDSESGDKADKPGTQRAARTSRPSRSRGGRSRSRSSNGGSAKKTDKPTGDEPAESITGVLDVLPQGHGLIRLEGVEAEDEDVYVSASQIRRCELRSGDTVEGPARGARRGERHRALVRVEKVNGAEPSGERVGSFDQLTPIRPTRRIPLLLARDDVLARAADLLAPLAYGQRVLIHAAPRSGRTTLLRSLAVAMATSENPPGVVVLLVDERPEEITAWRRAVPQAEISAYGADLTTDQHVRHAELAIARAKRRTESGEDVVVIIDSLTRLGVAYGDPAAVKPIFGAGRELEEESAGSLTIIATVLSGVEHGVAVTEAVRTNENATIVLDADLAAAGITPPLDLARCSVAAEESLRQGAELEAARRLRSELRQLDPAKAAGLVADMIRGSVTNSELLDR